jgi:hypothetical protein
MDPGHYFGGKAICQRMGWKSLKPLRRYIKQFAFPAYKRLDPRNPLRSNMWYSNEVLIGRWEWVMAQAERERVLARETELEELRRERDALSLNQTRPPLRLYARPVSSVRGSISQTCSET